MKKTLFAALLALACTFTAKSQTKGTNAIGLGFSSSTSDTEYHFLGNSSGNEGKSSSQSLSYGRFFKDNKKVSAYASHYYAKSISNSGSDLETTSKEESWGGGLSFTNYYRLLNKFYASAGAGVGYSRETNEQVKGNSYRLSASGGLSFFLNKHWAFEASLLSASASYSKREDTSNSSEGSYKSTQRNFNLSSSGAITNLGFNIYFLF